MGAFLVCDFFKEVGVDYYGKPDRQVKDIFTKLNLVVERDQDWKTFELFWHIAAITAFSPSVVDKIFWIAASGRWDKTLDGKLSEPERKAQQLYRKQRFHSLLQNSFRDI